MKKAIKMPKLGEFMAEGKVIEVLVKVGDHVEEDDPLMNIETGKMDAVVEALDTGTIVELNVKEGEAYECGTVIGYIEED